MNEKFFSLPEERQQAIINAGYRVFSQNSYKKSPMQEIAEEAGISFGVSAFLRRGELSIGMGIAILLYFLGIVANLSEGAAFLRVITPFGYTEGADILANGSLDGGLILCGMAYTVVGILTAYRKYTGKDLS